MLDDTLHDLRTGSCSGGAPAHAEHDPTGDAVRKRFDEAGNYRAARRALLTDLRRNLCPDAPACRGEAA